MSLRRYRRLLASAVLLGFLAGGMLPVLCHAAGVAAAAGCPDCPAPCCDPGHCSCASASGAVLLPALATPDPGKVLPASPPAPVFASRHAPVRLIPAPPGRPPIYAPSAARNIRLCSFQE